MKITLTLDDKKWACAVANAKDEDEAKQNVLDKVNEYLDACERDVGASDMANVVKELADPAKLAIAKAALGL